MGSKKLIQVTYYACSQKPYSIESSNGLALVSGGAKLTTFFVRGTAQAVKQEIQTVNGRMSQFLLTAVLIGDPSSNYDERSVIFGSIAAVMARRRNEQPECFSKSCEKLARSL